MHTIYSHIQHNSWKNPETSWRAISTELKNEKKNQKTLKWVEKSETHSWHKPHLAQQHTVICIHTIIQLWPSLHRFKGCKKEKVLVVQLCLTLCNPMDYSPPGSSVHNSRTRYWSGLPFSSPGDFPDPGIEHGLPRYRQILYNLSHEGSPWDPISNAPTFKTLTWGSFDILYFHNLFSRSCIMV